MEMTARIRIVAAVLSVACAAAAAGDAELIIYNAKVTTQSASVPHATAVAIRDGMVVAVGNDKQILALRGKQTSHAIDAGGRRLIPGLNDSHMHPTREARYYSAELRWDGVPTLKQALERVSESARRTPMGGWVRVVGGWSPHQFAEKRMPTPEELTEAAPDTAVFVLHLYSGGIYNAKGLEKAGITAQSKAPPGGTIELGSDGQPTGRILATPRPTILYQAVAALGELSPDEQASSTRHFYRELNRFGLTSVIDAGGGGHSYPSHYGSSIEVAKNDGLPLRISYFLFAQKAGEEARDYQRWISSEKLHANLDAHLDHGFELEGAGENLVASAGDFENFRSERPDLDANPRWREDLAVVVRELVRHRWPIRIHATYDETIQGVLTVFESVDREEKAAGRPGFTGLRWAIDHAETIRPAQVARIKALAGGVLIQGRMAFAGEDFAERYGARAAGNAPPIKALLDAGIPVGAGTDGTRVASYNPWIALYWLVSGKSVGGTPLLSKENRLSRAKALELYTLGSAWFSGEETVKGRIAPGQFADLALLDADFFTVPEERIRSIESLLTVTGGKVVHAAGPFAPLIEPLPPIKPDWSPVKLYGGYHQERRTHP